jgi:hypothetical protein
MFMIARRGRLRANPRRIDSRLQPLPHPPIIQISHAFVFLSQEKAQTTQRDSEAAT